MAAVGAGDSHSIALVAGRLPVPRVLLPRVQGEKFSALAQTLNRKQYAFEFLNSMPATNWSTLSTNPGNGALRLLTDPAATTPQRFYRFRQW